MVVTVTIPEGMTLHQIGQRVRKRGWSANASSNAAATAGSATMLGLGTLGAEGFLFPATYRFSPLGRNKRLTAMLTRFYEILTRPSRTDVHLGLNARQMVTMASIVEKEAKRAGRAPTNRGGFL